MIECKCRDCKERKPLCHSTCASYQEYKKYREELNSRIRREKNEGFIDFTTRRRKRSYGRG